MADETVAQIPTGIVTAISSNTLTIDLGGGGVMNASSYSPAKVGDTVAILPNGDEWLVLGTAGDGQGIPKAGDKAKLLYVPAGTDIPALLWGSSDYTRFVTYGNGELGGVAIPLPFAQGGSNQAATSSSSVSAYGLTWIARWWGKLVFVSSVGTLTQNISAGTTLVTLPGLPSNMTYGRVKSVWTQGGTIYFQNKEIVLEQAENTVSGGTPRWYFTTILS